MDGPHKQEFHVKNLPTRSVTLFPTRAQVVREIKDVTLKPGANEITVVGLTPTADEHSIKVEGTGSAIITDITVELLPNRDIFEEVYPDSESDPDKDESEEDDDDEANANSELEQVREKLAALDDEQKRATEIIASAESRLKILDAYGKSLDRKRGVDIEASVETYRKEREKVFKDRMDGIARNRELAKEIIKLRREEARLEKLEARAEEKEAKEKAKVKRAKARLREKLRRRDQERQKEKARIRKEREKFWPRSCYSVRITLDAGAGFTPGSSCRSSIASATDVKVVVDKEPTEDETAACVACDLSLSYVTSSAFWSPSYDLALSTTTNTAMLCFDARLTNMTSEAWANSKVILSTSQANFSGLQDDTPSLVPWRLRLAGRGGPWDGLDIAHSREERAEKEAWNAAQNAVGQQKPRANLFGVSQQPPVASHQHEYAKQSFEPEAMIQQCSVPPAPPAAAPGSRAVASNIALAGAVACASTTPGIRPSGVLSGSSPRDANRATTERLFGVAGTGANTATESSSFNRGSQMSAAPRARHSLMAKRKSGGLAKASYDDTIDSLIEYDDEDEGGADAETILEPTPEVAFQDSSFEETGLTATYDLPHLKTLQPSSTASKQRVARIAFSNVAFTRTVVAKYKPAAYLKARLRNASKLTLLKGPAGLTLDGTFLGRTTLPRCSAGDTFSVPLGVDPAIRVSYPKPDVTRSTTGVFLAKGESSVYTRTVTLVNTRAAAGRPPVALTVLDQVPVSEDEKLRVEVAHPAGMQAGGGRAVATGAPGKEGKEEMDWGRATATLKKNGEVAWDVVLNAGRSVKLVLRYEVTCPTGERVAQCF